MTAHAHTHPHTHTHTHTHTFKNQCKKLHHLSTTKFCCVNTDLRSSTVMTQKNTFKSSTVMSLKTILLAFNLLSSTAIIIIIMIIMIIIIVVIMTKTIIIIKIIIMIMMITSFLWKVFPDYFDMSALFLVYTLCLIQLKSELEMIILHGCILIDCCIY